MYIVFAKIISPLTPANYDKNPPTKLFLVENPCIKSKLQKTQGPEFHSIFSKLKTGSNF